MFIEHEQGWKLKLGEKGAFVPVLRLKLLILCATAAVLLYYAVLS